MPMPALRLFSDRRRPEKVKFVLIMINSLLIVKNRL